MLSSLPLLFLLLGTSSALSSERSPENDMELGRFLRIRIQIKATDPHSRNEYSTRWPDGVVHYYFSEDWDPQVTEVIALAMEKISNNTCIDFTTEPDDIMVRMYSDNRNDTCFAGIGWVEDDQPFQFNKNCMNVGTGVHELIHVLGFMHAHQRRDRDQYLRVNESMVNEWYAAQTKQHARQKIIVPYDYGSVMQYHGEEYITTDKAYMRTIGSRVVAYYDYYMINKFYNCFCGDWAEVSCENHGYPNPRNCSQCICPYGYTGDDCSQAPGPILEATGDWNSVNVTLNAGPEEVHQLDYIYKFLWIQAPENKTIEVRMNNISGVECKQGCGGGGFEVRTRDLRMTSPRECCTADQGGETMFKSKNNPTVVMMFNAEGLDEYDLSYRFVDA